MFFVSILFRNKDEIGEVWRTLKTPGGDSLTHLSECPRPPREI